MEELALVYLAASLPVFNQILRFTETNFRSLRRRFPQIIRDLSVCQLAHSMKLVHCVCVSWRLCAARLPHSLVVLQRESNFPGKGSKRRGEEKPILEVETQR